MLQAPVLEAALPDEVATNLGRLLGRAPVATLGDWVDAVRQHTDGEVVAIEELCHADEETPHWGVLNGETYHFQCFYDAIVLAAAVAEPVDVRTESPTGEAISARAVGSSGVTVDPPSAVFSFGIDSEVDPPGDSGPSNEDVYAAVCPWVRAFPEPSAYRNWADSVPATTVALPFTEATTIAEALVT
ncbi:MAG: organomercurial lyase [Salinirussus sp.]